MAKPAKCISVQQAKQLQNNWVTTREPAITQARGGQQDTREVVFNIAELEEFLDYVKDESAKKGITDPGVRLYFAAYNNMSSDYATVFLSATMSDDKHADNNYDIEPYNTITAGVPPKNY